jgi:hypothetical protein
VCPTSLPSPPGTVQNGVAKCFALSWTNSTDVQYCIQGPHEHAALIIPALSRYVYCCLKVQKQFARSFQRLETSLIVFISAFNDDSFPDSFYFGFQR